MKNMNYQEYLKCIQNAATQLAMKGHTCAGEAGVVDLRLTFTTTECDEDEGTDITMSKSFNALMIPLCDETWRIDEIRTWETTTEE